MLTYMLFVAGFFLLIKGADLLVDGAKPVARRLKVSDLAIGLTVVSCGSSLPELVVNILASVRGSSDLAVGNVLGSNTANILLGLGVAACIRHLKVRKSTVWKEIPFSLLAVLVVAFVANDAMINGSSFSSITRADGLVFLSFFAIFLYYIYSIGFEEVSAVGEVGTKQGMAAASLKIAAGIVGLALGGQWVVDGAIAIGMEFGISEALIGLTVVAVGTSLPEIATSAVAAYRKSADIAVGNVIGSNIFNIFWVLGVSSTIRPIDFRPELNVDIMVVLLATVLLFAILFVGRRHTIDRWEGASFIVIYAAYIAYIAHRG